MLIHQDQPLETELEMHDARPMLRAMVAASP
jgi:hypothetical protein